MLSLESVEPQRDPLPEDVPKYGEEEDQRDGRAGVSNETPARHCGHQGTTCRQDLGLDTYLELSAADGTLQRHIVQETAKPKPSWARTITAEGA